jgi:hypothetical protein
MSMELERKAAIDGGIKCGSALFHLLEKHGIKNLSEIHGTPDGIVPNRLGRFCIDFPFQNGIIDNSLWKELQCIGMIDAGAAILPDFSFDHEGVSLWIRILFERNGNESKVNHKRYNKKIIEVTGRLRKLSGE